MGAMSEINRCPHTLRIGILVFDGFEPIDVWGFAEAFTIARFIGTSYLSPPPYPFEVVLIANQAKPDGETATPAPVKSANGPRVAPDYFRDEALEQKIDLLMISGGIGTRALLGDEHPEEKRALLHWVRLMDERVAILSSVCTGSAIMAAAGLLDGKPAATNHASFEWVAGFGPRVHWDNVSRWADASRYVTSAGVSAGTDMGFYLVERLAGRAVAEAAAKAAEYDWHRDPEEPIYYP